MPAPLRKTHPRKKAIAKQKSAFCRAPDTQSSDGEGQYEQKPLWKQIRALERSEAALHVHNVDLAADGLIKDTQIAQLRREKEQQERESTGKINRMRQSGSRIAGDYQRVLGDKLQLKRELDGAREQKLAAEQLHSEQQAVDARENDSLRGSLDGARTAVARLQAELSGANLETKIYRCALQALYHTFESEDERRWVLRALEISRDDFTKKAAAAAAAAPPPLLSPTASDASERHVKEEEEQSEEGWGASSSAGLQLCTPVRCLPEPLTPVSMDRVGSMALAESDEHVFSKPRREGLRPRKHHVDQFGSPW